MVTQQKAVTLREGIAPPKDSSFLRFLYGSRRRRLLLKLLITRNLSRACGAFLDSRLSKPLIRSFVRKNSIDLSQFESDDFRCFNDCFCRKIKEGIRPIDDDPQVLVSPCDGLLSAYSIQEDTVLPVKQCPYTLQQLLCSEELAKRYRGGTCLVFRLCVTHYHRYCYPADGAKSENVFLEGKLHTVRPVALEKAQVFAENCREYTLLETESFGGILQMEVGAMLVGKIANYHGEKTVCKGEEKGKFLYGGSTVILLLEKDAAELPRELFSRTAEGLETPVQMGEALGLSKK